jgi:hypothetical protein
MDPLQTFEEFLATQSVEVSVLGFMLNLTMAAVLSLALGVVYRRYGRSLSNRKRFASNFVTICMTTMMIITVVKSSLALSLGLVGALSIVRFRTAIKEPEELSYLFLAIAIGLGFGAGQWGITLAGFALIVGAIVLRESARGNATNDAAYLIVQTSGDGGTTLVQMVDVLKGQCPAVSLKRYDEDESSTEAHFVVEFDDFAQLHSARDKLMELDKSIKISFLDGKSGI